MSRYCRRGEGVARRARRIGAPVAGGARGILDALRLMTAERDLAEERLRAYPRECPVRRTGRNSSYTESRFGEVVGSGAPLV